MAETFQCCVECFEDFRMRQTVEAFGVQTSDACEFCGALPRVSIDCSRLLDWFAPVLAIYERAGSGVELPELIDRDWHVFSPTLSPDTRRSLLSAIVGAPHLIAGRYKHSRLVESTNDQLWIRLRKELMHRNRWFLPDLLDTDRLRQLLGQLSRPLSDLQISSVFRARVTPDVKRYKADEMGPPPPGVSSGGRANPPGISYLYVASSEETAIAEVRARPGDYVCVAEFKIQDKSARVVDLRNPRSLVTPFGDEEDDVLATLSELPFLERLGSELSRPVGANNATVEYVPTQYLSEFIKNCGFAGLVYRSSMDGGEGYNIALFHSRGVRFRKVQVRRIESVKVDWSAQGARKTQILAGGLPFRRRQPRKLVGVGRTRLATRS